MPAPITVQANTINDITLNSFKDQLTGDLQNGKIKLGGSTYSVSFTNTSVKVTRDFSFLNLFRSNKKTDIATRLFSAMEPETQLAKATNDALKTRFSNHNGGTQEVALYGMSEPRMYGKQGVFSYNQTVQQQGHGCQVKGTMIDAYNAYCGINPETVNGSTLKDILGKIQNGTLNSEMELNPNSGISPERLQNWKNFLKANIERVDIFSKVRNYIREGENTSVKLSKKTGWAAEVRKHGALEAMTAFVRKNMDPSARNEIGERGIMDFAYLLIELSDKGNSQSDDTVITEHFRDPQSGNVDTRKKRLFNDMISTAFFRQTSKLGLEFFRQERVPVVFQMSNLHGHSVLTKSGRKETQDKWWTNQNFKPAYDNAYTGKYGTITFSEMRHVERLNRTQGNNPPLEVIQVEGMVKPAA